jgi:TonB family protein
MEEQMFNNLIESSSHRREFRRRGSFFLFTTASYALLFVIAGVISIYAYDARMEDQNLELATIMPLIDPPAEPPRDATPAAHQPTRDNNTSQNLYIRKTLQADVNEPDVAPDKISVSPNPDLPRPRDGIVIIGNTNVDPIGGANPNSDRGTGNTQPTRPVVAITEPPPAPAPTPKPAPKILRKTILNGEALVLPKPPYPPMAKQIHVQGTVNVQVLIDEKGHVVSATPVSGHPLLAAAAKAAALQARFSPTMLGDQPVKVSGVITYNFLLQ